MNGDELTSLVGCLGVRVVALDELPKRKQTSDQIFIYNVERRDLPGMLRAQPS
jgi:hypothetical protein